MGQYWPGVPQYTQHQGMQQLTRHLVSMCGGVSATTNGVHAAGSYHYSGYASDIGDSTPSRSFQAIWAYLYKNRGRFAELFGPTRLPDGGLYHYGGRFYDSTLQAAHQNHIHVAFLGSSWVVGPPPRRGPLAQLTDAEQHQLLENTNHIQGYIDGVADSKAGKPQPPADKPYRQVGYWVGERLKQIIVQTKP